ncbi:hypothetical protein AB0P15_10310 [Streptomyces sp. NPDC087917]|uniref:hypothetical protein n=1 Tax=unclassified Streptomyces TaxID=2593676 RepID=UPI003436330A
MTTHPQGAGAPTDLDAVIAGSPADATGALWRLTGTSRSLDSDLVRLRPGAVVADPAEPTDPADPVDSDRDGLLLVLEGAGRIDTGDGPRVLRPHSVCRLARDARRSLTAGPEGLTYLIVRTRRPGLGLGGPRRAVPDPAEGGEPACRLHRVCVECGRLATEADARYCSRCGTGLPD